MKITNILKNQFGRYNFTALLTVHHWTQIIKGDCDHLTNRIYIRSLELPIGYSSEQVCEVVALFEQSQDEVVNAVKFQHKITMHSCQQERTK